MPYMLRQRLTNKTSLTGTPTWRYKLPSLGRYTALELVIDCNRYATRADGAVVYPLETQVTKIEVLEGASRAVFSLTASQLDGLNYFDFRRPNARRHREDAGSGNLLHLFLMGGRDLYDREYGFDFAKLGETYLEYTHTFSADTAEKFDVSDHEVTIYGWRWMGADAPNFTGYRRVRQLDQWTTSAADALKTVQIPVGNPIRRIVVQAKSDDTTIGGTVKEIELKVNDGEYVPVHITSPMHWVMQEVSEYDLHNTIGGIVYFVGTGGNELPRWWSYYQSIQLSGTGATSPESYNATWITLPASVSAGTTGNKEGSWISRGWGFQKCLRIGFDHDYAGYDLLQTAGLGSLDLELTENAASKDCAVFVEDVLRY
jgi:hypothetical protein